MTTQTTQPTAPMQVPPFAKLMMQFQVFMLRRNWLGAMGAQILVITVKGRKTGKVYSTPVGFLRDGETLVVLSPGAGNHWFRNALQNREVQLNLQGQDHRAHVERISDPAELKRLFEVYKRERVQHFDRLFGVKVDAPAAELEKALASRSFLRLTLVK